jgi:hypothetical protein
MDAQRSVLRELRAQRGQQQQQQAQAKEERELARLERERRRKERKERREAEEKEKENEKDAHLARLAAAATAAAAKRAKEEGLPDPAEVLAARKAEKEREKAATAAAVAAAMASASIHRRPTRPSVTSAAASTSTHTPSEAPSLNSLFVNPRDYHPNLEISESHTAESLKAAPHSHDHLTTRSPEAETTVEVERSVSIPSISSLMAEPKPRSTDASVLVKKEESGPGPHLVTDKVRPGSEGIAEIEAQSTSDASVTTLMKDGGPMSEVTAAAFAAAAVAAAMSKISPARSLHPNLTASSAGDNLVDDAAIEDASKEEAALTALLALPPAILESDGVQRQLKRLLEIKESRLELERVRQQAKLDMAKAQIEREKERLRHETEHEVWQREQQRLLKEVELKKALTRELGPELADDLMEKVKRKTLSVGDPSSRPGSAASRASGGAESTNGSIPLVESDQHMHELISISPVAAARKARALRAREYGRPGPGTGVEISLNEFLQSVLPDPTPWSLGGRLFMDSSMASRVGSDEEPDADMLLPLERIPEVADIVGAILGHLSSLKRQLDSGKLEKADGGPESKKQLHQLKDLLVQISNVSPQLLDPLDFESSALASYDPTKGMHIFFDALTGLGLKSEVVQLAYCFYVGDQPVGEVQCTPPVETEFDPATAAELEWEGEDGQPALQPKHRRCILGSQRAIDGDASEDVSLVLEVQRISESGEVRSVGWTATPLFKILPSIAKAASRRRSSAKRGTFPLPSLPEDEEQSQVHCFTVFGHHLALPMYKPPVRVRGTVAETVRNLEPLPIDLYIRMFTHAQLTSVLRKSADFVRCCIPSPVLGTERFLSLPPVPPEIIEVIITGGSLEAALTTGATTAIDANKGDTKSDAEGVAESEMIDLQKAPWLRSVAAFLATLVPRYENFVRYVGPFEVEDAPASTPLPTRISNSPIATRERDLPSQSKTVAKPIGSSSPLSKGLNVAPEPLVVPDSVIGLEIHAASFDLGKGVGDALSASGGGSAVSYLAGALRSTLALRSGIIGKNGSTEENGKSELAKDEAGILMLANSPTIASAKKGGSADGLSFYFGPSVPDSERAGLPDLAAVSEFPKLPFHVDGQSLNGREMKKPASQSVSLVIEAVKETNTRATENGTLSLPAFNTSVDVEDIAHALLAVLQSHSGDVSASDPTSALFGAGDVASLYDSRLSPADCRTRSFVLSLPLFVIVPDEQGNCTSFSLPEPSACEITVRLRCTRSTLAAFLRQSQLALDQRAGPSLSRSPAKVVRSTASTEAYASAEPCLTIALPATPCPISAASAEGSGKENDESLSVLPSAFLYRDLAKSFELFNPNQDGFEILVDCARFLPENVTISKAVVKVMSSTFGNVAPVYESVCQLERDALSPAFDGHCMYLPEGQSAPRGYSDGMSMRYYAATLPPNATILVRIDTLESATHSPRVAGYAALSLFSSSSDALSQPDASRFPLGSSGATAFYLTSGSFQLPLHQSPPDKGKPLSADALLSFPHVSCASVLVRVRRVAKGAPYNALPSAPEYASGVFDSSRCVPTPAERSMYATRASVSGPSVRELLTQYSELGAKFGLPVCDGPIPADIVTRSLARNVDPKVLSFGVPPAASKDDPAARMRWMETRITAPTQMLEFGPVEE